MLTSGAAGLVPRLAAGDILPLRELFRAGEPGELHLHRVRQRARRLRPGLPRPLPQPRSHRLHGAGRQQGEPGELCQGAGERGRGDTQEELQRARADQNVDVDSACVSLCTRILALRQGLLFHRYYAGVREYQTQQLS